MKYPISCSDTGSFGRLLRRKNCYKSALKEPSIIPRPKLLIVVSNVRVYPCVTSTKKYNYNLCQGWHQTVIRPVIYGDQRSITVWYWVWCHRRRVYDGKWLSWDREHLHGNDVFGIWKSCWNRGNVTSATVHKGQWYSCATSTKQERIK